MTPDEMKDARALVARARNRIIVDREAYRAYIGVQFLLDQFSVTLDALERVLADLEAEQRGRAKMLAYLETFHSNDKELIENVKEMLSSADEGQGQQQEGNEVK